MSRCPPYSHLSNLARVIIALKEGPLPEFSEELLQSHEPYTILLRSIVLCCWNKLPNERPTMEAILRAIDNSLYPSEGVYTSARLGESQPSCLRLASGSPTIPFVEVEQCERDLDSFAASQKLMIVS